MVRRWCAVFCQAKGPSPASTTPDWIIHLEEKKGKGRTAERMSLSFEPKSLPGLWTVFVLGVEKRGKFPRERGRQWGTPPPAGTAAKPFARSLKRFLPKGRQPKDTTAVVRFVMKSSSRHRRLASYQADRRAFRSIKG